VLKNKTQKKQCNWETRTNLDAKVCKDLSGSRVTIFNLQKNSQWGLWKTSLSDIDLFMFTEPSFMKKIYIK